MLASSVVGHDALVDLAGEEALQASNDVTFGPAVRRASGDVVDSRLMESQAHDDRSIEGGVGLSVAAPIEAVPASVIPDEAGMGQAPQSFAKAASERIRSGLSPNRINISAAVWAPTPKLARSVVTSRS